MAYTTIDDPSKYFHTRLYTGTGSSHSVTNNANAGDFQPDLIWIKNRTDDAGHPLFDSSRGVNKNLTVNSTDAEATVTTQVTAFNSNGFTMGSNNGANGSSDALVAWQWKCNGGTTETAVNESGDNPANVRQTNTTAGFSIITSTGTGGAGTIAHGLGAVPHWIISKGVSDSGGWVVYHQGNTSAPETDALNLADDSATSDNSVWYNDTAPTSSVFTLGTTNDVNGDARTYVHYVFTEIQGYSKFGSYTGNGDADGPFIYTGFKPAWVMFKRTDDAHSWGIVDHRRNKTDTQNVGNVIDAYLAPDLDNDDSGNSATTDFLSNGFKHRRSGNFINNSGSNYIYMAFAEHPFVSSEGVPATAR